MVSGRMGIREKEMQNIEPGDVLVRVGALKGGELAVGIVGRAMAVRDS